MPVDRLADEALGPAGVHQVDRDGRDTFDAVERVHRARAGDDQDALGRQGPHDGEPDPLARAGHDCDLSGELEVHRQLPRRSSATDVIWPGSERSSIDGEPTVEAR